MADTFRVTCHKPDNNDRDRRIQGLGGPGGWYLDLDTLIRGIESGSYRLWTLDSETSKSVWVIVAERNRRKYLKTETDGVEPNNLLALQGCP